MTKYEIIMIVDPKADISLGFNLLKEVFGEGVKKAEKLENNQLAYEINKSKHGQYILANVETDGKNIAEFTRRSNISKEIWRQLVINLHTEKFSKEKKSKKNFSKPKRPYVKRPFNNDSQESNNSEHTARRPRQAKPVTE
ncbi:30S ribosomal protein S6 [Mycoplasma leonicaptivi]|uniref:30S ribosomal protein S6 n=1 Tax=Mycoplasma leonicaptivi TaxID=36742 RepID=UPI00048689BE|nr:30S ribosomal protein S6 [Mycoplasma leonicaptivi]